MGRKQVEMSASTLTYTLNHHTLYFLMFRAGTLALVSRVTPLTEDEKKNLISVVVMEDLEESRVHGEPMFRIEVGFPQRQSGDRIEVFPMIGPYRMTRKRIRHGVQGQAVIDIGPTFVILNVTSDVGSYFKDSGFTADNAECI